MTENVKELQNLVLEKQKLVQEKDSRIKELEGQLHWFKRQAFGQKSEKLISPQNTDLFGKEPPTEPETEKVTYTRKKPVKGHGRNEFPEHLEVKEVTIDVPEEEKTCPCCGKQKKCIGDERTKKYEAVPASVYIQETIRLKYACPECPEEGVVQANMPPQVIPGGNCGTSLINHVIISKYLNHQPFERQSQDFKRQGIPIATSTMGDWKKKFCKVMDAIYGHMKNEIKSSRWIHTDDTSVPVQIKRKKGKAHKGYFWVYIGEDTNVIFDYTHSRSGKGPKDFLEGYSGYLHADAFPGYDKLFEKGTIKECACWSHGRRKFFDAYEAGDKRAKRVLELCGRLFFIERHMKEKKFSLNKIKSVRNRVGRLITAQIKKWMDENDMDILPKSDLGGAISYMRKNWDAFHTYMEEGFLSMHNNLSERQIRKVVLGRSNWIFCGSEHGARQSALIYSLTCTCRLLEIDPYEYFNDVLVKILIPGMDMAELTPIQWKKGRSPAK